VSRPAPAPGDRPPGQLHGAADRERQADPDRQAEQRIRDERRAAQKAEPRRVRRPGQRRDRRGRGEPGQREPGGPAGRVHRHPAARQETGRDDQQAAVPAELAAGRVDRPAEPPGAADQPGAENAPAQAVGEVVAGEDPERRGHDDQHQARHPGVREDAGRQHRRLGWDHREHAVQRAQAG